MQSPTLPHYPTPELLHENIHWEFTIRCSSGVFKPHRRATKAPTLVGVEKYSVLRYIYCKRKEGCQRNCGCRKAGHHCSPTCTSCEGLCENIDFPEDSSDVNETEERQRTERREMHTRCGRYIESHKLFCSHSSLLDIWSQVSVPPPLLFSRRTTSDVDDGTIAIEEPPPGPFKRQRLI